MMDPRSEIEQCLKMIREGERERKKMENTTMERENHVRSQMRVEKCLKMIRKKGKEKEGGRENDVERKSLQIQDEKLNNV